MTQPDLKLADEAEGLEKALNTLEYQIALSLWPYPDYESTPEFARYNRVINARLKAHNRYLRRVARAYIACNWLKPEVMDKFKRGQPC